MKTAHERNPDRFMATHGLVRRDLPKLPVIRPETAYQWHHREITSGRDLRACLRAGPYAWPGGYALAYITDDGGMLCPNCVMENLYEITDAIRRDDKSGGWRVHYLTMVEYMEDKQHCSHCSQIIE